MGKKIISESDKKTVIENIPDMKDEERKVKRILESLNPENIQKREDARRVELQGKSKDIIDLVFEEYFIVNEVLCRAEEVSISHIDGNTMLGGRVPTHNAVYVFSTELTVKPGNNDIPIKKLEFLGYSAAKAGDQIWARIPRYVIEKVSRETRHRYDSGIETFYLDRDWNEKENAIEITILDDNLKNARIERAINFRNFYKC